jgi:prolyl-tRNA synthetase
MADLLNGIQRSLLDDALKFRSDNTFEAESFDTFVEGIGERSGFWTGAWCGDPACEQKVTKETTATIRVLPRDQEDPGAPCLVCGRPGIEKAVWAKAY